MQGVIQPAYGNRPALRHQLRRQLLAQSQAGGRIRQFQQMTAQGPANWTAPTEPFRIGGNLYYVGTAGLGAYLLTSPHGHVLIDGAMPTSAKMIEANIVKLGFKPAWSVRGLYRMQNEVVFHAAYRQWSKLMEAGMRREHNARMAAE